ncbi:hypothetical protein [Nocardia jiangxiensis]|uniref:FxLD family lantipeptide n=1 Tax=Nocardia jiangxiensis TaxID=282685 RepID=A0ABW6S3T6_9NOCA|nr:hypothetical protein [Nocardia jiangxiensis]
MTGIDLSSVDFGVEVALDMDEQGSEFDREQSEQAEAAEVDRCPLGVDCFAAIRCRRGDM